MLTNKIARKLQELQAIESDESITPEVRG